MTEAELQEKYNRMVEIFGNKLPDPEQEPIRFSYYVKLFKYYFEPTQ